MAATTKAMLATENAVLRSRVSELEAEVARLKEQAAKSFAARQDDFKMRAAAAREEAMRTGRTVRL